MFEAKADARYAIQLLGSMVIARQGGRGPISIRTAISRWYLDDVEDEQC